MPGAVLVAFGRWATVRFRSAAFAAFLSLTNVAVQVFSSSGVNLGAVNTDNSGNYTTLGLPAGTYYVRTSTGTLFELSQLYTIMLARPASYRFGRTNIFAPLGLPAVKVLL